MRKIRKISKALVLSLALITLTGCGKEKEEEDTGKSSAVIQVSEEKTSSTETKEETKTEKKSGDEPLIEKITEEKKTEAVTESVTEKKTEAVTEASTEQPSTETSEAATETEAGGGIEEPSTFQDVYEPNPNSRPVNQIRVTGASIIGEKFDYPTIVYASMVFREQHLLDYDNELHCTNIDITGPYNIEDSYLARVCVEGKWYDVEIYTKYPQNWFMYIHQEIKENINPDINIGGGE